MKPLFEEHDNRLFYMLEEPVPLTPDAEMPCLVRLIQDVSPMGRYNRDAAYFGVIGKLFVAQKIKENPFYSNTLHAYEKNSLNQDYCIASIHTLEIIGYQAEEGSRWWALYQMMQGEKICHHKSPSIVYCKYAGDIRRQVRYNCVDYMSASAWLNGADKNGWQIYKEPELKYKVGDWVEYRLDGDTYYGKIYNIRGYVYYLSVTTEEIPKDQARAIMLERIIRKLSPSEVIVHIGCLSGTVAEFLLGCDWAFKLIHGNDKESYISPHALDSHTRELVESLLEAMRGGG